jgi:hypothetical protein
MLHVSDHVNERVTLPHPLRRTGAAVLLALGLSAAAASPAAADSAGPGLYGPRLHLHTTVVSALLLPLPGLGLGLETGLEVCIDVPGHGCPPSPSAIPTPAPPPKPAPPSVAERPRPSPRPAVRRRPRKPRPAAAPVRHPQLSAIPPRPVTTSAVRPSVRRDVSDYVPRNDRESQAYQPLVDQVTAVDQARSARNENVGATLPGVVWFGLLVGALVAVGLIFTLQIRRSPRELLLSGLFSALIAFLLFLIWDFDAPFARGMTATANPFLDVFPYLGG